MQNKTSTSQIIFQETGSISGLFLKQVRYRMGNTYSNIGWNEVCFEFFFPPNGFFTYAFY